MMGKRHFEIELTCIAQIELDEAVIAVVTDEWRQRFYDLATPREIAEHIAFNLVIRGTRLSQLDGWGDHLDGNARIVMEDWCIGDQGCGFGR